MSVPAGGFDAGRAESREKAAAFLDTRAAPALARLHPKPRKPFPRAVSLTSSAGHSRAWAASGSRSGNGPSVRSFHLGMDELRVRLDGGGRAAGGEGVHVDLYEVLHRLCGLRSMWSACSPSGAGSSASSPPAPQGALAEKRPAVAGSGLELQYFVTAIAVTICRIFKT